MKRRFLCSTVFAMIIAAWLVACGQPAPPPPTPSSPVTGAKPGPARGTWQEQWEYAVAEARKEGTVAIASNWGPKPRQAVTDALRQKYGLDAEINSAGASQQGEKILSERRAGIYHYDIAVQGANFGINIMKPAGVFDPIEPALILAEVKNPKLWLGEQFPWFDKARTMVPFLARVDTNLSINTTLVKPNEITSYKDLLAPKWKGKLLLRNPTTIGAGSGWFRENGADLGLEYMRALAKQEPVVLNNDRQLVEWLAQGKYAVLIAGNGDQLNMFINEGANIAILDPSDSRTLGPSSGIVSLINQAPHKNAATVFINWILSKEGQTVISRSVGLASRRVDVPTDHVVPVLIPQQSRKYTEYSEESLAGDAEAMKNSKEIFGPLLGK